MHQNKSAPLSIDKDTWHRVVRHALHQYPNEACGILLSPRMRPKEIVSAVRVENASKERLKDRYVIGPKEFLKVVEKAETDEQEVCGFYHSHPDHPAVPSSYDREKAWNGYIYLIVAIRKGRLSSARAWSLEHEEEAFKEATLHLRQGRANRSAFGANP